MKVAVTVVAGRDGNCDGVVAWARNCDTVVAEERNMADTKTAENPEEALRLAELERLRLQNQKLKLEMATAGKDKPWRHRLVQMVPLITASLAIAGFLWGVVQYRHEQKQNRDDRRAQANDARETAQREFMKPWLESQREIYLQALEAATTVANSDDSANRREATEQFWQLYQGKMILVETKSVSGAMVRLGKCLDGADECLRSEMNSRCRALAMAIAESMAATARMTFEEFKQNQFRYGSGR